MSVNAPILPTPPRTGRGLLTWGQVRRALQWAMARCQVTMPDAAAYTKPRGVEIVPNTTAAEITPFTVGVRIDDMGVLHTTVQPGFILANAGWLVPTIGGTSMLANNELPGSAPSVVWLKLRVNAYIAPAYRLVTVFPLVYGESWRWSGVRLLSAEIIGDETASHANVKGTINVAISGTSHNASVISEAEMWIKLAQWDDETGSYTPITPGNRRLISSIPEPYSASSSLEVYKYLPSFL